MTTDFLSERARKLAEYVSETGIDICELIDLYDRWRSAEHLVPADSPSDRPEDRVVSDIRQRFGIATGMAAQFEAFGDALRVLVDAADDHAKAKWHEAKIHALEGRDRDKKLLVLRHLDVVDYEDDLILAALVESLAVDDQTLALTFTVTTGMLLDPARHEHVLRFLAGEIASCEKRRRSSAALFGAAIEQMFEHHAEAVPPRWLIDEWTAHMNDNDDPASFAALVDLGSLAVLRSGDAALIQQWMASERPIDWILAASVVRRMDLSSVADPLRRSVAAKLSEGWERLAAHGATRELSAQHAQWIQATVADVLNLVQSR